MTAGAAPAASADALDASRDTLAFLSAVLPATGGYFIATPYPKPKRGYKHHWCASPAEAAQLALELDQRGETVYFALAAFLAPYVDVSQADGKTKRQYRIRSNVRALRCLFLDIDVKPGVERHYATQEQAIDALGDFCSRAGLPLPWVCVSGNGLHAYFPFTDEVPLEQWQPAAEKLKRLCEKLQFWSDPSRTADPTSVLRPANTSHRKDPVNPKRVRVEVLAAAHTFNVLNDLLEEACARESVVLPARIAHTTMSGTKALNEQFSITRDFPPCSAVKVADRCQQLARMRDARGNIPYRSWFHSLQLICHSVEGDPLAHTWSSGYPEYSPEETDDKLADLRGQKIGPTLCSTFEEHNPGGCDGCPSKGKILSPVQLGSIVLDITAPASPAPATSGPDKPTGEQGHSQTGESQVTSQADAIEIPTSRILSELNEEYAWVWRQKQIFRFRFQDFIKPADFKLALANRAPVQIAIGKGEPKSMALADAWLRWAGRCEHLDIVYEPGKALIHDGKINLWSGWPSEPVVGDVAPWRTLLDEAYGQGTLERAYAEQWMAYQIQHPGTKLFTAHILWSPRQGIGKTIIGETFGKLFGVNFDTITESDLYGEFNEWVKGKQFILGEEITSTDQRPVMNRLKHLITGDTVRMNDKQQPKIVLRNTINFMFTSNHPNAVQIDINDRRFFVVEFAGRQLPAEFFARFVYWRDNRGGLQALMHHLLYLPLGRFDPKAAAPMTSAKADMMDTTFSDLERWIFERYMDPQVPVQGEIVYAADLVGRYIESQRQSTNDTAVGRALTRLGSRTKRRVAFPDARKQLHAIRRQQHWAAANDREWAAEYAKGRDVRAQISTALAALPSATVPQSRHGLN